MFAGYRSIILRNQEHRGGVPNSARDISFQEGRQLALRDIAHVHAKRADGDG